MASFLSCPQDRFTGSPHPEQALCADPMKRPDMPRQPLRAWSQWISAYQADLRIQLAGAAVLDKASDYLRTRKPCAHCRRLASMGCKVDHTVSPLAAVEEHILIQILDPFAISFLSSLCILLVLGFNSAILFSLLNSCFTNIQREVGCLIFFFSLQLNAMVQTWVSPNISADFIIVQFCILNVFEVINLKKII